MPDQIWISVATILVLTAVSAYLSAAETALTAVSRARMHHLERKGNARAALVRRLREDKERLLGAILIGNNLVTILSAALATSLLVALFGAAGVVYATLAVSAAVLVFGEILPKAYALNHADRAALVFAPSIRAVVRLLSPVALAAQAVARTILGLLGEPAGGLTALAREEELRGAIELHRGDSREIREERRMLRSVMDLADIQVEEIMTHRRDMVAVDISQPPAQVVEQVLASPFTRLPLWDTERENIVGVLHAKDLLRAVQARSGRIDDLDIRSVASAAWFIPDTTSLFDQLHAFRRRREHFALVIDEYGGLLGIVTLEDILEEIVGDISDEHDVAVPGVRAQADGSYVVAGNVTLRDLNREFEWALPDEEANTVAGLVLHEARQLPGVGQKFEFYGFRFEILRRMRNQITSIRMTPPRRRGRGAA